jgi:hypothetical protein
MKPARLAWVPLGLAGLLLLSLCRSRSSPLSSIPTPTAPPTAPLPMSSPSTLPAPFLRLTEPLPSPLEPIVWPRTDGLWVTDPEGKTLWRVDREAIAGLWSPDQRFLALVRPDPARPEHLLLDLLFPLAGERRRFPELRLTRAGGMAWARAMGSLRLWFVPAERPFCLARLDPESGGRDSDLCFDPASRVRAIHSLTMMPDGRLAFVAHDVDGRWTLHQLDPITEQIRSSSLPVESRSPERVRIRLLPSPTGRDLAILMDVEADEDRSGLHLLDLEAGAFWLFVPSPRPREAIWAPDGRRLLLMRPGDRGKGPGGWLRIDLMDRSRPVFSAEGPSLPWWDPPLGWEDRIFFSTRLWLAETAVWLPLAWRSEASGRSDRVLIGWEGGGEEPWQRLGRLIWLTVPGGSFAGFAGLLGENPMAWPVLHIPEASLSVRYPPGWIPRELPPDEHARRRVRFIPPLYASQPPGEAPGIDCILYRSPITGTLEEWAPRREAPRTTLPTSASGLPALHVRRDGEPAEETWIAAGLHGIGLGYTDRGAVDLGSAFLLMREGLTFTAARLPAGLIYWSGGALWRIDPDGRARLLARPPDPPIDPFRPTRLSPDDRFMESIRDTDLYQWDLQGNVVRNLTWEVPELVLAAYEWPARPEWLILEVMSPSALPPRVALAAIRRDGADYRILDPDAGGIGPAAPGPDGQAIAYVRGEVPALYVWEKGPILLDWFPSRWDGWQRVSVSHPAWAPDGRRLAWSVYARRERESQSAIVITDLRTRRAQVLPLWTRPEPYPPIPSGITWSADGQWLAFLAPSPDPRYGDVWVLRADGKEGRHLFADVKEIAWSPREPLLLALRPRWDGLWSVRLVEPGTWRLWEAPWPPGARPVDWRP